MGAIFRGLNLVDCLEIWYVFTVFGNFHCALLQSVFCSAGADRRVMVWDLRRIGDEQEVDEVEDGPPELLFVHGTDFSSPSLLI